MQSGPGSLVSAFLSTSLSPVCGLEVFTTPVPQPIWSTREQRPPRMFTKNVGTMKPGWSQQPCVPRGTQPFGLPGRLQPGMPAHVAFALPQGTQTACSQQGKLPTVFTVNLVDTEVGNDMIWPSAVTHGSWRHAPAVPPQSASVVQAPNRLDAALVVQILSPAVPLMTYVSPAATGVPMTIGAHGVGFDPQTDVVVVTVRSVVVLV